MKLSVIGCGLIAGLYFAFSTFIMKALGRIDDAALRYHYVFNVVAPAGGWGTLSHTIKPDVKPNESAAAPTRGSVTDVARAGAASVNPNTSSETYPAAAPMSIPEVEPMMLPTSASWPAKPKRAPAWKR